ncbi:uncharacterized protein EV420DRAFT_1554262, partial [Desarmillaria tabescens]
VNRGLFVILLSSVPKTLPGPAVYRGCKTLNSKKGYGINPVLSWPISKRLSKVGVWVHLGRMTRRLPIPRDQFKEKTTILHSIHGQRRGVEYGDLLQESLVMRR